MTAPLSSSDVEVDDIFDEWTNRWLLALAPPFGPTEDPLTDFLVRTFRLASVVKMSTWD